MKINIIRLLAFFFFTFNIVNILVTSTNLKLKEIQKKIHKVLFLRKLEENRSSQNPLNFLNFKNMIISSHQMSLFESTKNNSEEPDTDMKLEKFIYTVKLTDVDLPCINRSYVCIYQEFMSEYSVIFKEINYDMPVEIVQYFGTKKDAMNKCIVLFSGPQMKLNFASWICHPDTTVLKGIQNILSDKIRLLITGEKVDMFVRKLSLQGTQDGFLKLESERVKFINMEKNVLFEKKYSELNNYATALYLREPLPNFLSKFVDSGSRCFKLDEKISKEEHYFCVYYKNTDLSMQKEVTEIEARWISLFYADIFTKKGLEMDATYSLNKLSQLSVSASSSSKETIEVESTLLNALTLKIREEYLIKRHSIIQDYKDKKLTKVEVSTRLNEIKVEIINNVCNMNEVCIKSVNYLIEKQLLPLNGSKEKFAMDSQNPFNAFMAAMKIPVSMNGSSSSSSSGSSSAMSASGTSKSTSSSSSQSIGAKMIAQAASLKGGFSSNILAPSGKGQIPNMTNIKLALNTLKAVRDKVKYQSISQIASGCRSGIRSGYNNLKRKLAILTLLPSQDPFLEYLGFIHDKTMGKVD